MNVACLLSFLSSVTYTRIGASHVRISSFTLQQFFSYLYIYAIFVALPHSSSFCVCACLLPDTMIGVGDWAAQLPHRLCALRVLFHAYPMAVSVWDDITGCTGACSDDQR